MSDPSTLIELPALPTKDDTIGLFEQLCGIQNSPVVIDATNVKVVTALEAQILFAAKARWNEDAVAFSITGTSDGFTNGLSVLGFDPKHFESEVVQ